MLYAASSRRSTVLIQRQVTSRESTRSSHSRGRGDDVDGLPSRPGSAARPNTANSFRADDGRPSTPYKNANGASQRERIGVVRETFMLDDRDLEHFFRVFRFMAKCKGDIASSPSADAPKKRDREKNEAGEAPFDPADEKVPEKHPWEEGDAARITLPISDFFATFELSHTSNGGFLDGIFDLVGTKDLHAATYGEFLDGVCTFGMFKLDDMIRLVFFILDKEKEGRIPRFQLLRFVESIHGKKIRAFERVILRDGGGGAPSRSDRSDDRPRLPAAERRRASVDYAEVRKLCVDYPSMMEPVLLLQSDIRRRIMGEAWWRRRENRIEKHFRTLDRSRERERRREERRLLRERKKKIVAEIGWMSYYFASASRSEAESEHPRPIVSLEEETGEVCVEWTLTDGKDEDGSVEAG